MSLMGEEKKGNKKKNFTHTKVEGRRERIEVLIGFWLYQ
jgi:hypothetical protein